MNREMSSNTASDARPKTGPNTDKLLFEARNVVKKFGDFAANDDVSLALKPGTIHALLGENGAGKSTLVKIMYGSLQPTCGELRWRGAAVAITNPAKARRLGIGMVFQHFSLFEALTVTENIALALPGKLDLAALGERIGQVSENYGLPLTPNAIVADLSVGERQRIEIVRCLLQSPALLIMDEPTAVLTPQEAEQLFITLNRLADEGCAVLYISHRLEEVRQLCHHATILRHGKVVANVDPQQETATSLARQMIGANVQTIAPQTHVQQTAREPALRLNGLSMAAAGPFGVGLKDIHLAVYPGEVVAIAGVAGNGQAELFAALSGERRMSAPDMVGLRGIEVGARGVTGRRLAGAAFVPEERLGHSAVPGLPLSENIILTRFACDGALQRGLMLDRRAAHAMADRVCADFDVRKARQDPEARALSGGNLQKFVIGRELDRAPGLLVVNQPTWGVDAGAAALIRQQLIDLAAQGAAVLVISQDLDEIFAIAHRIAVISRGQMCAPVAATDMTLERIGLLMAGAHERHHDQPAEPLAEAAKATVQQEMSW